MLKQPETEDDSVLITEDFLQKVRNIGLRRLTRSPMSRYQFEQYLIKRDVPLEAVNQVATRFEELKLLDDREFAQMWVRSRRNTRGTGWRVLRQELRNKGISAEIIESFETSDPALEYEMAFEIGAKKFRSLVRYEKDVIWRRLTGFLIRRGHTSSTALRVTSELLDTLKTT
jgi:regulatory protein